MGAVFIVFFQLSESPITGIIGWTKIQFGFLERVWFSMFELIIFVYKWYVRLTQSVTGYTYLQRETRRAEMSELVFRMGGW